MQKITSFTKKLENKLWMMQTYTYGKLSAQVGVCLSYIHVTPGTTAIDVYVDDQLMGNIIDPKLGSSFVLDTKDVNIKLAWRDYYTAGGKAFKMMRNPTSLQQSAAKEKILKKLQVRGVSPVPYVFFDSTEDRVRPLTEDAVADRLLIMCKLKKLDCINTKAHIFIKGSLEHHSKDSYPLLERYELPEVFTVSLLKEIHELATRLIERNSK